MRSTWLLELLVTTLDDVAIFKCATTIQISESSKDNSFVFFQKITMFTFDCFRSDLLHLDRAEVLERQHGNQAFRIFLK